MIVGAFHVTVTAFYIFVSRWMYQNVIMGGLNPNLHPHVKIMQQFSLRYLTNWTFILQNIFFISCVLFDLINFMFKAERLKERIRKFRAYIFTVLAGPSAMVVTLLFWSIWAVDRELVYPKHMDTFLPVWVNHSLHTTTTLFIIAELFLCYHRFPDFYQGILGFTVFLILYKVCLLTTYFYNGFWLYPILKEFTWTLRIVLILSVYVIYITVFVTLKFTSSIIWGKEQPVVSKKQKKKKKKN